MIGIFFYNLTKVWFKHVWPEIRVPPANTNEEEAEKSDVNRWTYLHPQLLTLNELKTFIRNLIKLSEYHILRNLSELRREKPTAFCILICSTLTCTAYIGNCIDGFKLIFSMVIALSTLPGIYLYLLPESLKAYLQDLIDTFQNLLQQYDKQLQQRQHLQLDLEKNSSAQDQEEEKDKVVETLSLFDHLMRNSLLTQLASLSSSVLTGTPSSSSSQTTDTVNSQSNAMDGAVPIINEKIKKEEGKDVDESFCYNKNSSSASSVGSSAIRRRLSDDLSSNDESTSLIDLDDDQQDGFVML